jgi:hypothetical protein
MWKINDIIENIHLGSKFEHGMFICTKTEIDNQTMVVYVDVHGKNVTIDTEPSLSVTDDMYNILYNSLKQGLRGFKINIKTKRKRTTKNNVDDTDITEHNVDDVEDETTTKTKNTSTTKTKRGRRGRKKKSKSKSE